MGVKRALSHPMGEGELQGRARCIRMVQMVHAGIGIQRRQNFMGRNYFRWLRIVPRKNCAFESLLSSGYHRKIVRSERGRGEAILIP